MKARVQAAAVAAALALGVGGCDLTESGLRKGASLLPTIGMTGGEKIVPRQCALKMALVTRPLSGDEMTSALWAVADSQAASDAARRTLESNGLRLGLVTGDLPAEAQAVLNAPPPNQVNPATVILPDGDSTLVNLEVHAAELNLLLALQERATVEGKRYTDVNGFLRLTARQDADGAVALRLVPELHHGPVRAGWGVASGGGTFAPQQYVVHNGQAEETFRDLAADLTLRPGQVAVISLTPGRKGSLGHFLFSQNEVNSDRSVQKVLFVWASQFVPGDRPAGEPGPAPAAVPPGLQPDDPPEMPAGVPAGEGSATRAPGR